MNEYRRFVQNEIDRRGWTQSDVEKHGGPTRQVVHKILTDTRKVLEYRPKQETIEKLATAFGISEDVILAHVAMAMELPVTIHAASLDDVSDEDLLDQIRKRMKREGNEHDRPKDSEPDPPKLRAVTDEHHTEDSGAEQKIAAYDRELGDGIRPDQLPES